ncbi:hypothetical protein ICW40_14640 [Actinotalea ferrariae]|uniref:hypothetical protein n=1 Tax=Actinotalea ferrariae TaxID=1386098 RepID=UPI001C8CAEA9|nr:hypothetical protein [Actinotalea ferrariae]MBX9246041.1 hypothetical protein [Actinotalea ferrariae]
MTSAHEPPRPDPSAWVRAAGRAPSPHNTQPWAPRVVDGRIELGVVPSRVLCAGDPTSRDLLLALGAWVESAAVAAAADGRSLRVEPTPHLERLDAMPVHGPADPATPVLVLHPEDEPYDTPFTPDDVRSRRVHRGTLTAAPDVLTDAPGVPLWLRLEEVDAATMRHLVRLGTAYTVARPGIAAELVRWLRLSEDHPRYDRDGMTDRMLLLPRPIARLAAPFTRRARLRDRLLAVAGRVARAIENLGQAQPLPRPAAADGPRHLVLVADLRVLGHDAVHSRTEAMDSRLPLPHADVVEAGRVLQRMWLHAHRAGVSVAPHSEVVDSPAAEAALRRRLGLRRAEIALAVFSAGRASTPAPPSPRLTDAEPAPAQRSSTS